MSNYASTVVSVSATGSRSGVKEDCEPWVRLEQVKPREIDRYMGMALLHHLWLMAASNNSAMLFLALGCPVEVRGENIHVFLDFWAWPSDPGLPFDLNAAHGRIIQRRMAYESREFSIFVNNSRVVELPYYMEMATVQWLTPTFAQDGSTIPQPTITRHGSWLELSTEVFGVVRVRGIAVGESATVEMVINKPVTTSEITPAEEAGWYDAGENIRIYTPAPTETQKSFRVSNLQNTVTATWLILTDAYDNLVDASGNCIDQSYCDENECKEILRTESLRLEVPPCVKDFLELCPDSYMTIFRWCTEHFVLSVYYNACSGGVMSEALTDPYLFCSQSVVTGPSPFLRATSGWLL